MKIRSLLFVVTFSLLFVIGALWIDGEFSENYYKVEIEKCNSSEPEIVEFRTKGDDVGILVSGQAVPVLRIGKHTILNVCDYKILEHREVE